MPRTGTKVATTVSGQPGSRPISRTVARRRRRRRSRTMPARARRSSMTVAHGSGGLAAGAHENGRRTEAGQPSHRSLIRSEPREAVYSAIHYNCASYAGRTGFSFERKHWCRWQTAQRARVTQPPHRHGPIRGAAMKDRSSKGVLRSAIYTRVSTDQGLEQDFTRQHERKNDLRSLGGFVDSA